MQDVAAELITELKTLRKGRGIDNGDLRQRAPKLCVAVGVGADAPDAAVRTAVREWLIESATRLPKDLNIAVLAAFALPGGARDRFYKDRVAWLAAQLGRRG